MQKQIYKLDNSFESNYKSPSNLSGNEKLNMFMPPKKVKKVTLFNKLINKKAQAI